ncbi:MAG: hypothetical protein LBL13_04875 [Bacteroidales bacterium]|nr:hypothetical protein [Bacteroidales bacterium]
MKKVLPINYPPLTTSTGYADALAILTAYEKASDWVYSQYIQTFAIQTMPADPTKEYWPLTGYTESFFCDFDYRRMAHTINDGLFFDREKCPFLNVFDIPFDIISIYENSFVSFIKHCIDQSMYIYAIADVSVISAYPSHSTHPMLIYGYDDDEQTFLFGDFLQNSVYSFSKCSYTETEQAFQNAKHTDFPLIKSLAAVRFAENGAFKFDILSVREMVRDYLYPNQEYAQRFSSYTNSYFAPLNWRGNVFLGKDLYVFLAQFLEIELALGMYPTDLIPFHALYDHKEMMVKRIEYFLQHGYLNENKRSLLSDYDKIRDATRNIRNLIIKFNQKQDAKTVEQIYSLLRQTSSDEEKALKAIFDIE